MSYEEHFRLIRDFLEKNLEICNSEFLRSEELLNSKQMLCWYEEIKNLNLEALNSIENQFEAPEKTSLKSWLSEVKSLSYVEKIQLKNKELLDGNLSRKLTAKKKHELEILKHIFDETKSNTLVDIGGGVGHTSNVFVYEKQRNAICVDMNEQLQEQGLKKIKKWIPSHLEKVRFVLKKVSHGVDFVANTEESLLLGLHSCGKLSTSIVKEAALKDYGEFINYGCCYHKLEGEYNLSSLAKERPLSFSNDALQLAAKGYAVLSKEGTEKRLGVKRFRYLLHFLQKEKLGAEFSAIGSAKKEDYAGDFVTYVRKFEPKLSHISDKEIMSFFNSEKVSERFDRIFRLDFVRASLSRLIELYIVLDRALYLKEMGKNAKLLEVFDRKLSPRNLMLYY